MKITNPRKLVHHFLKLFLSNSLRIDTLGENIEDIFNFIQISDLIATAGQPTEQQLPAIKETGYQVIVNLAPLDKFDGTLPNEEALVESLGMEYVHIPVIWNHPTLEDFDRFVRVMQANTDRPVFVHCAGNFRVSAFMYLYRRLYQNIDEAQAQKELQHIWIPDNIWQQFMQRVMGNGWLNTN